MIMAAVMAQAAQGDATNSILWVGLVAFVSLAASVAGIWRAFFIPKEYATLRQLVALEARFDKHLDQEREDAKAFDAKFAEFQREVFRKLDGVKDDVNALRVELEKRKP